MVVAVNQLLYPHNSAASSKAPCSEMIWVWQWTWY